MALTTRELRRWLDPIRRKIRLIVNRAIVTAVLDDQGFQVLQLKGLPREVLDKIERFQNYGFTSVPLTGSEAIVAFVGGSRSHGVAIAVDDRRHRKKNLQPGEVALYSDEGDSITLKRGNLIEIKGTGKLDINVPDIKITADTKWLIQSFNGQFVGTAFSFFGLTIQIQGLTSIKLIGTTTIEGRKFLEHTHSGVQTGAGVSGPVV